MSASPAFSQDLYLAAAAFAAHVHRQQKVPGGELPYLLHLSSVAMEVIAALQVDALDDPDLAVQCALLHDCVEDQGVAVTDLEARFGARVAAGVSALSKDGQLPKDRQMADSLERIRRQPREVWWVKLADRITNLAPAPPHWTPAKRQAYRAEARQILQALGEASPCLAARLRARIDGYVVEP
jgi:(p)ppGpp synthase/HD superfamily hydrolase